MASYRRRFSFEVVTPGGGIGRSEVVSVVFAARDGMVGVLGGRAPMVAQLGTGAVLIEHAAGPKQVLLISGGFAQVRDNVLTILTERCTPADQLDAEAVWDEIELARRMPAETPEEQASRDDALAVARTRFSVVQKAVRLGRVPRSGGSGFD